MEDEKFRRIVITIVLFILVLGAIVGVLFLATSQLKNLEFTSTSSKPVVTAEHKPAQEEVKTEVVDEKEIIENSTAYSDSITDILFLSKTGDYAVMLSLDPTLMLARLTNIDTNATVLYKDAIATTIAQAVSLDDSTLKKICLAATGKTEIDHYVRLSPENTRDLVSFMQNEEKKNPVDLSIFQGEDLGTLLLDEFVDFANCNQLSFDSLSKFWANLSAFSNTDISFNKLSTIVLSLKSYSLKRNWERLVFEPVEEELAVEEIIAQEPVADPTFVAPISFAFSQPTTIKAEDIQTSSKPESMNLEDATAQAVVSVPAEEEQKSPEPETKAEAEPEAAAPQGTVKTVKRSTITWSLKNYCELTTGFGYSYGKDKNFTGWERELSARLEIGKKLTKHLSFFGSFRVIRNSSMTGKSLFKQNPKAYTLIPGIGLGLDFKHGGIHAEFNGYGIASEWKYDKIDYRMGTSLIPYVSIPITQKFDMNIVAPASISFKPNAYRISGALSIGFAYSEI